MASYTGNRVVNQTAGAGAADTITFPQNARAVEVTNYGASNNLYVTTDGVTAPTVGGQDCWTVPPGASAILPNLQPPDEAITNWNLASLPSHQSVDTNRYNTVVKVICTTANAYSVSTQPVQRSV